MKAKMTKLCAQWAINNPEVWVNPRTGRINNRKDYETMMKLSMACLLGENIYGEIGKQGADSNVFRITWKHKDLGAESAYYEKGTDYHEVT